MTIFVPYNGNYTSTCIDELAPDQKLDQNLDKGAIDCIFKGCETVFHIFALLIPKLLLGGAVV